jgi:hypothetical protein
MWFAIAVEQQEMRFGRASRHWNGPMGSDALGGNSSQAADALGGNSSQAAQAPIATRSTTEPATARGFDGHHDCRKQRYTPVRYTRTGHEYAAAATTTATANAGVAAASHVVSPPSCTTPAETLSAAANNNDATNAATPANVVGGATAQGRLGWRHAPTTRAAGLDGGHGATITAVSFAIAGTTTIDSTSNAVISTTASTCSSVQQVFQNVVNGAKSIIHERDDDTTTSKYCCCVIAAHHDASAAPATSIGVGLAEYGHSSLCLD